MKRFMGLALTSLMLVTLVLAAASCGKASVDSMISQIESATAKMNALAEKMADADEAAVASIMEDAEKIAESLEGIGEGIDPEAVSAEDMAKLEAAYEEFTNAYLELIMGNMDF